MEVSEEKKRRGRYGRAWVALRRMTRSVSLEELKDSVVYSFTGGRTTHLHEMTREEYARMCETLEAETGYTALLRSERSKTLKLLSDLGIDTNDWERVDAFCMDKRIAGKAFRYIRAGEHGLLRMKLWAINRSGYGKGRIRPLYPETVPDPVQSGVWPSPAGEA